MSNAEDCDFESLKVVFRHHKNVGRTRLARFIDEACATGQINMYDRPCTPFKDILKSEHVTVCELVEPSTGALAARGFSFCRGDVFLREKGRLESQNRARALLGMEPLPNHIEERQEAARRAAEIRHAENRRLGLERKAEAERAVGGTE